MGTSYVDGSNKDGRCSRKCEHELELWTELVLVATLLLPICSGWQRWTMVGMGGGAATGGGHAGGR